MRILKMACYNSEWPKKFESEKIKIQGILDRDLLEIHHIGSTSVPGMYAKPIIDILCVVKLGTNLEKYNFSFANENYEIRGECLDATIPGTPGRYYYPKIENGKHTYHLHICHESHPQIIELLQLKGYLINNPEKAQEYSNLKRELIERYSKDNVEYMRGKDTLIKDLILNASLYYEKKSI